MAHADYFLGSRLSVGPLVQYGGTATTSSRPCRPGGTGGDPGLGNPRLMIQGGIGAILVDITDTDTGAADSDTSFVIPLGIGVDYAVTRASPSRPTSS